MGWRGNEQRGEWLERWLKICKLSMSKMAGFGEQKERKKKRPQQKTEMSRESLLKNAINHHIQGDLKNAEKYYRAAIDSGLLNIASFSNLGIICQTSQRTEEAIALYKKTLELEPNNLTAKKGIKKLEKRS